MRKLLQTAIAILSMILGALGGCAFDVIAQRPGESLTVHAAPASQPTAVATK